MSFTKSFMAQKHKLMRSNSAPKLQTHIRVHLLVPKMDGG